MPRALLRLSLLLLLWPGNAVNAADLEIAAFEGVWRGSAISESDISVNFQLTSRDIDVTVRSDAGGGFSIVWNTVQRQKGDPNNPKEKLKTTKMGFTPVRPGVWRATGNRDPLEQTAPFAWAYVKDRTLHIVSLQIYADGRHETQSYRRELSGLGMTLEFTRNVDGEKVRSARGRLVKAAK
ncbi:MAG: hypothetical protein O2967_00195 [Proteobacteria bacterium]|nr:hypothetical protein [Pseudomonadota bacterium]